MDEQADRFTDWAAAKGATYKNWEAAFRNWLRKAVSWERERSPNGNGHDDRPLKKGDYTPEGYLVL